MLNLIMDLYHIDATLTLFLLGNRGSIYYSDKVSNLCLATLGDNNQWEPSKEINLVISPFFLCTDQLQVHNNKHPPTQKKKTKDQATLIKFQ